MPPMVPIGRLYAEAFWLTVEAREEGRAGTGGGAVEVPMVDVEVGVIVGADGTGSEAAAPAPAPARSQGLGGEAIAQGERMTELYFTDEMTGRRGSQQEVGGNRERASRVEVRGLHSLAGVEKVGNWREFGRLRLWRTAGAARTEKPRMEAESALAAGWDRDKWYLPQQSRR